MSVQIVASSPKALEAGEVIERKEKYPFEQLEVKQSFSLQLSEANLQSLRTLASRRSKGGKRFVVVVHDDVTPPLVEVARIA